MDTKITWTTLRRRALLAEGYVDQARDEFAAGRTPRRDVEAEERDLAEARAALAGWVEEHGAPDPAGDADHRAVWHGMYEDGA